MSSASSGSLQKPMELVWGEQSPPFFVLMSYIIVVYFDFVNFSL